MKLSEFISKYGDCEVTEEMEKFIEKPKGKWIPKVGEAYFCLDSCGLVVHDHWINSDVDTYRQNFLRIFKAREEVTRYREIIKACKEASFEPDWNDFHQHKLFMVLDHSTNTIVIDACRGRNFNAPFYFKNSEIIEELIKRFGDKDIAKYVLGVEVE